MTVNLDPSGNNKFVYDAFSHIILGRNVSIPIIGIGPNENGPFVFYFTITNQFDCSLKDSIDVIISENAEVDFNHTVSQCGKNEFYFEIIGSCKAFYRRTLATLQLQMKFRENLNRGMSILT
ncbi:MAG TPA: hypothetical protein PKD51_08910 [Saprospiraceae bacterium]|nr:hypothetical protein [Saprospiraceae bacterium]